MHILLIFLFGIMPLVVVIARTIRKYGVGLTIVSPIFIYSVAYFIGFLIRPLLYKYNDFSYEFYNSDFNSSIIALSIGAVTSWFVSFGWYITENKKYFEINKLGAYGNLSNIANCLSLLFSIIFICFLYDTKVIFQEDPRSAYLGQMSGNGLFFLVNLCGVFLFFISLFSSKTIFSIFNFIVFLSITVPNVLVSNRNIVSLLILSVVLIYVIKCFSYSKKINSKYIVISMISILFIAIYLGMNRSDKQFDTLGSIEFLAATFDMKEMLELTIQSNYKVNLGQHWIEDISYTYIPRKIWKEKPILYGANRSQAEVVPELSEDGHFLSTYPIGMYGETIKAYGYLGIPFLGVFLGFVMALIFNKTLTNYLKKSLIGSFYFSLWLIHFGNSLSYMRSFGQFLSAILFNSSVLFLLLLLCFFINRLLISEKPKPYKRKQTWFRQQENGSQQPFVRDKP